MKPVFMTSPLIAFKPEDDNGRTIMYNILLNPYYYHLFTSFLTFFRYMSSSPREAHQNRRADGDPLDAFSFYIFFGDELISVTADVCEAFCLFRVFCGLIFSDFRAFRG